MRRKGVEARQIATFQNATQVDAHMQAHTWKRLVKAESAPINVPSST